MPNPPRALPDYFNAWMEYSEGRPTGKLFREWSAILTISGALTRRVYLRTDPTMPPLYPNCLAILTGKPGTGKDIAIGVTRSLWRACNHDQDENHKLNVAPKGLSPKGFLDALISDKAKTQIHLDGETRDSHSLLMCSPELGVLIPEYNPSLLALICDAYNCDEQLDEQTRSGKGEAVEAPYPHIAGIFGTQPAFLGSTFPEEAYGMGFFSRIIVVHESTLHRKKLYRALTGAERKKYLTLWTRLVGDLRLIVHLNGEFKIEDEVQHRINEFHLHGCDESALTHSRFEDYNVRRSFHLQKLAMCFSISRSSELVLRVEDLNRAQDLLFRTETRMPRVFSDLSSGRGFHNSVEEVVSHSENVIMREQQVHRILRKKHKPYEVEQIIKNMIKGGELEVISESGGLRTFRVVKDTPKLRAVK